MLRPYLLYHRLPVSPSAGHGLTASRPYAVTITCPFHVRVDGARVVIRTRILEGEAERLALVQVAGVELPVRSVTVCGTLSVLVHTTVVRPPQSVAPEAEFLIETLTVLPWAPHRCRSPVRTGAPPGSLPSRPRRQHVPHAADVLPGGVARLLVLDPVVTAASRCTSLAWFRPCGRGAQQRLSAPWPAFAAPIVNRAGQFTAHLSVAVARVRRILRVQVERHPVLSHEDVAQLSRS